MIYAYLQRLAGIFLALLCLSLSSAWANEKSDDLAQRAMTAIDQGRFRDALQLLAAARKAESGDSRAIFLMGVTQNRLGDGYAASSSLQSAARAGYQSEQMAFELGWALMSMGRFSEAAQHLEKYASTHPRHAQAQEFLGRCDIRLARWVEAEGLFDKALALDGGLKNAIDDDRAALRQAKAQFAGRPAPVAVELASESAPSMANEETKPLVALSLSSALGFNSNVIAMGNGVTLPSDVPRKGAAYLQLGANITAAEQVSATDNLGFGYSLKTENYRLDTLANSIDHLLRASYFHSMDSKAWASVNLSDDIQYIGGSRFSNTYAVKPSLGYPFAPDSNTEFTYTYSTAKYFSPAILPSQDRSGHAEELGLNHRMLQGEKPFLALAFSHTRNSANGSDFNFGAYRASATYYAQLSMGMGAEITASYANARYVNMDSYFGGPRRDWTGGLNARLYKPIANQVRLFGQMNLTFNRSNINFYQYNQSVMLVGLEASY